jgi:hypothetical protein
MPRGYPDTRTCPDCKEGWPADFNFCPDCGADMDKKPKKPTKKVTEVTIKHEHAILTLSVGNDFVEVKTTLLPDGDMMLAEYPRDKFVKAINKIL